MSQTNIVSGDKTGFDYVQYVNSSLQAVATDFSGNSEPTNPFADMKWLDTSVSPPLLKRRNTTNTGWVTAPESDPESLSSVTVNGSEVFTVKQGGSWFKVTTQAIASWLHITASPQTVADLRLNAASWLRIVSTSGYYSKGDGGGATYYLDTADTVTTDDGYLCIVDAGGRRWKLSTQDKSNVKLAGAKGDGLTNDTIAIQNVVNSGAVVYFPTGVFLCNIVIPKKIVLKGDGSFNSILKPFSTTEAAVIYRDYGDYWTYNSEVRGLGFHGVSTKTGVGFTFSRTLPNSYATSDEYSTNVKFYGCHFKNLEKGVQCPSGNIGCEFYSCGFQSNKYGVYAINNKFGGDEMHAGNKYFYGGEFDDNDCGFYCHDTTVSGFSAVKFDGTIVEYNKVGWYFYVSGKAHTPVVFTNCHIEANGQMTSGASTVTIDAWSGTTRSNQTLTKHTAIFDGPYGQYVFNDCGIFTDIWLKAATAFVTAKDCRVETQAGYGGAPCIVDNVLWSSIRLVNPYIDGGFPVGDGIVVVGHPTGSQLDMSYTTNPTTRWFITEARSSRVADVTGALFSAVPFTTGASTSGVALTGSVVAGGQIFSTCNEFSKTAFGVADYARLSSPDVTFTTTAGFWVATIDFMRIAGNPKVSIWNRSTNQFATYMAAPAPAKWYTFATIGYSPGGQQLWIDFSGSGEDCTWRVSAYQLLRFPTFEKAQAYLASGMYTGA